MLKIGWAMRDFTPERPAMLQGQMHTRVASKAMDPLTMTCLAIEDDQSHDCALMISCDMAFIYESLQDEVRRRLALRLPEMPAEKVFISATHTHTSLVYIDGFYPHPGGDVMTAEEGFDHIAAHAVEVAVAAWQARAPHATARAFGHAVVGHNRRAVYADGTAQMYGRTDRQDFRWIEGSADHSLDLLFSWDTGGRLDGIVVVVPCPSQVDEGLCDFSADFWHEIRQELRARYGAHLQVLALCGAAGDQSPHFLLQKREEEEMRNRRGVTERQEIALRVADAVDRALAVTAPDEGKLPFVHLVRHDLLTPRSVSKAERDWAEATHAKYTRERGGDSWWPQRLRQVVDQFEGCYSPDPVPVEIHAVRIGDLALVTNPFELYVDYGFRIEARSPAAQTLTVQITAGSGWYLPSQRAVEGGSYGAMPAVCQVGPEGGQQLVEMSLDMLNTLFAGE